MELRELTEEQQALAKVIIAGVKQEMSPDCRFDAEGRRILHEYIDSVKKENADGETLVIVFRIGNNIRDGAKTFMKWVVWVVLLLAAYFFYTLSIKGWLAK